MLTRARARATAIRLRRKEQVLRNQELLARRKQELQAMGNELDAFSEEELQRRPEVIINIYAVVMAYIRIGLKGIGALALLWATVVLLGGFVSDLRKIDFWCLTVIAFVQATGLSDAMGDAPWVFFQDWIISLVDTQRLMIEMQMWKVRNVLFVAHFWIFGPVVYFALSGPIWCVTLWALRLGKQDYGIADGDASKANLKPALTLFYCVSLAHGAICLLCTIVEAVAETRLVKNLNLEHGLSPEVLDGYLQETKQMCVNSPAPIERWNLITYGAGLLDSQLPEDYASGGRVLTMLIDQSIPASITRLLIRSPRQRIQKLIGSLAWRSPAEREIRWLAARIVEHLAGHLNLAHFPGALECISTLFDTSCHNSGDQEVLCLPFVIGRSKPRKTTTFLKIFVDNFLYFLRSFRMRFCGIWMCSIYLAPAKQDIKQRENGERIDENLVLPGLRILENLAHDGHNCTLIYNTKHLLSKILAPVSSNEFVQDIKSNTAWTKVVDGSLKVVSRLMGSPGCTGEEMRNLIADDKNTINNLEAVVDMDMKCNNNIIELQMRAIEVLTRLALHHTASTSATGIREHLILRAVHIFLTADWMADYLKDEKRKMEKQTTSHVKKKMKEAKETASQLKEKAGEALALLSGDSEAINSFTACTEDDVRRLTDLLDSSIKTIKCEIGETEPVEIEITIGCRISAAVILKHSSNYVKETTLHKVLAEFSPIQAEARGAFHSVCTAGCITISKYDIENPKDGGQDGPVAIRNNMQSLVASTAIQQCRERRLQAELLSLVAAIRASGNVNFAAILISQPQPAGMESFVVSLKKMVEDNMYATPACLAIQKLSCEMVIEFLQDDGNIEVIDKHNIVGTLMKASKAMAGLESDMLFAGVDRDCHGVPLKPLSSVLAKNAEDLLTQKKQALGINIAPDVVPPP